MKSESKDRKLKPGYVKRLYTQLRMEKNLLTEREHLAIKHVYLTPVSSKELEEMFEEPASQVRGVAHRAGMRLHVEAQNIKWREEMRSSHIRTMFLDTVKELRKLSKDMDKWKEAIERQSWEIDHLQRTLNKAWDYWLLADTEILDTHSEPRKDEEVHVEWICSPCARHLGGIMPEGYVCTWHPDTCSICRKHVAVTAPADFRLNRDGTPMGREPTMLEVD